MVEVSIFCLLPPFRGVEYQLIEPIKLRIATNYRHELLFMK